MHNVRILDSIMHFHHLTGAATLVGRGAAHTVRFFRHFRVLPIRRARPGEPKALRVSLKNAVLTEIQRCGVKLSAEETDALVEKVADLLDMVFSGELCVDKIPSAVALLRSEDVLADFLRPLNEIGGELSEGKKEILKGILEENIQLRQVIREVEQHHE